MGFRPASPSAARALARGALVIAVLLALPAPARAEGSFTVSVASDNPLAWTLNDRSFARFDLTVTNTGETAETIVVSGVDNPPGLTDGGAVSSPTPGLPLEGGASGTIHVWLGSALSSVHNPSVDPDGADYEFTIHLRSTVVPAEQTVAVTVSRSFPDLGTGTLTGRVLDAVTGLPILANVEITAARPGAARDDEYSDEQLDPTGRYSMTLPEGTWALAVDATGYESGLVHDLEVTASATVEQDVELTPSEFIASYTDPVTTVDLGLPTFRAGADPDLTTVATMPGFYTRTPESGDEFASALDGSGNLLWQRQMPEQSVGPTTVLGLTATDGAVDVSPDGSLVALANSGGTFDVVERDGDLLWSADRDADDNPNIPGQWGDGVIYGTAVEFSPDGASLAAGSVTGQVYLFDADTGALAWQTPTAGEIRALRFTPNGSRLLVGSGDNRLHALDAATGSEDWHADLTFWPWHQIAITSDGSRIAVGSKDGVLRIFDGDGVALDTMTFDGFINGVAFTPDGQHLLIDSGGLFDYAPDGSLRWFRPEAGLGGEKEGFLTATGSYVVLGINPGDGAGGGLEVLDLDGNLLWRYRPPPGTETVLYNARLIEDGSTLVATGTVDGDGAMLVFRGVFAPPLSPAVTSPAASSFQSRRAFNVAWGATQNLDTLASYDVEMRSAPYNGAFGSSSTWLDDTTSTSASYTGGLGRTYCFGARATGTAGNVTSLSAERCTAVPLNDTQLTRSSGWTKKTLSTFYEGRATWTRTTGAYLTRTGAQAKRIALVATRCPTCGTVDVYLGATKLKRISLSSSTTKRRQVISVAAFSSVKSGTVKVKVVSSGKDVFVEGLGLARA